MWMKVWLVLASLLIAAAPGAALAADAVTSGDYRIGTDDVISISVWDNKDLDQVVFVRPDGKISLPLLGEIQAGGRTVSELETSLGEAYSKTVKGARVTVGVREIRSRPIFFVGGVGKPGPMQLTQELTLLQAISLAGGLVPAADLESAFLLRGDKRIAIDFVKLIQKGDTTQNIKLMPSDTVVVPLADYVYVQGEVRRPGLIKLTKDLTLMRAIAEAGGITNLGSGRRVTIVRMSGDKKENVRVNLNELMDEPQSGKDTPLRANDIIIVPERLF